MRRFLPLACLGMVCFTEPAGVDGIWVVAPQVVAIAHAHDCDSRAHTKIITVNGSLCVHERPEEVRKRLEAAK